MEAYQAAVARITALQTEMLELNYQLGGDAAIHAILEVAIQQGDLNTVMLIATHWRKCFAAEDADCMQKMQEDATAGLKIMADNPDEVQWMAEHGAELIGAMEEALPVLKQLIQNKAMAEKAGATLQ